jgi:hypothetical protein
MLLTNTKKFILKNAMNAFAGQAGITLELLKNGPEKQLLRLQTPAGTAELEVMVIEGSGLAANAMLVLCRRLQNLAHYVLVITHVTAEIAEDLRNDGIQFIDTAGNGYINQPPLYVFIKGNKMPGLAKTPPVNRVFKQTGLRVLYALLCNPGLENETYRTIAAKTKVALGMVNWVIKDLNELGFLMEMGKGRARQVRLVQKEKLLDRWIAAYAEQLRPKLVLGRYRGAEGWWQRAELQPEQALWGGEVAAAKLTDYLKPQTITVYVDQGNLAAVLISNRLKKDPEGDVELVGRFWQLDAVEANGDMVHPILVYADLLATGNQRNMETAQIIYDKHIIQLVREN